MKSTFNRISQRDLRLLSGIVMLIYIAVHLANHALGLISLDVAEAGLRVAVTIWHTVPLTVVLLRRGGNPCRARDFCDLRA
jgi:hypothetical protein